MTIEAITTFVHFEDADGNDEGRYQNSSTGSSITFESNSYGFLPFIYNGATKSLTGDNLESTLTIANNRLAIELAHEASLRSWSVRVDTVLMDPSTFTFQRTLTTEYWIVNSMSYNVEGIQLALSTAIDAVNSSVPNKVLRSQDVGALPVTSRISNA
tara:strand:- start:225 stop:695 length:471 start_codon:yes stop_codon:yes gene_type:complete